MAQGGTWVHARRVRVARCVFVCVLGAVISLQPSLVGAQSLLGGGWQTAAIGSPALPGSAAYVPCLQPTPTCGNFSITSGGHDIWNTSDQFRFVYRPLVGDGVVIARVASLKNVSAWSKAGVMIRESLAPGSRHAFALVSAGKGVAFQRRRSTNGSSLNTAGPLIAAPQWLKLKRRGSAISAYSSSDGVTWTLIGSDKIAMPQTVWVGLAVTSHYVSATTTAAIEQATVAPLLPPNWTASDIGSPARPGSISYWNSTFTLSAAGADIWGTADEFLFAYQRITGDADIIARVAGVKNVDPWSKAGVMMRESLSEDAAHASLFLTPSSGVVFQRRLLAGMTSDSTTGDMVTAPGWLKLERRGALITALYSPDGALWTVIGSETIAMPSTFYVGLAVTSHDATAYTRAPFDSITVQPATSSATSSPSPSPTPTPSANIAPTVQLTAPSSGLSVTIGSPVTLSANASDTDGTIARVDFYAGGTFAGTDTTAPYSVTWTPAATGLYGITAVAYDNGGATAASAAVTLSVVALPVPSTPVMLTFTPSANDSEVTYYYLRIYTATANLTYDTPVAVQNLGKPPVVNGTSSADVTTTITTLAPGSYVAVVSAVWTGGETFSAPSPPFTR